jgi:hypothetical protein
MQNHSSFSVRLVSFLKSLVLYLKGAHFLDLFGFKEGLAQLFPFYYLIAARLLSSTTRYASVLQLVIIPKAIVLNLLFKSLFLQWLAQQPMIYPPCFCS